MIDQGNFDAFTNPMGWKTEARPTPDTTVFDQQQKELHALHMAFKQCFETKAGKTVLKFLRENTIESAAWMPSIALSNGIEAANAHAYSREGQNALVRDIERRIMAGGLSLEKFTNQPKAIKND